MCMTFLYKPPPGSPFLVHPSLGHSINSPKSSVLKPSVASLWHRSRGPLGLACETLSLMSGTLPPPFQPGDTLLTLAHLERDLSEPSTQAVALEQRLLRVELPSWDSRWGLTHCVRRATYHAGSDILLGCFVVVNPHSRIFFH